LGQIIVAHTSSEELKIEIRKLLPISCLKYDEIKLQNAITVFERRQMTADIRIGEELRKIAGIHL
jgi:hypothetical protein